MSFGGSQPKTQTVSQTQEVKLPAWMEAAGQNNYAQAQDVAGNYQAPTVPGIAGFNGTQQQAWTLAGQNATAAQPGLQTGIDAATRATNYTPGSVSASAVTPHNFLSGNVQAYMNPYTDQVVNTSLNDLNTARQQALNGVSDAAIRSGGAFGSRQGIVEGVTNAESARAAGTLSAQLRSQAFDKAAGLLDNDNARDLQGQEFNAGQNLTAQQLNQQAGLTANQQSLLGASTLGSLAPAMQQAGLQGAGVLEGIGNRQQAMDQAGLQRTADIANGANMLPVQQLDILNGALSATPHGQTSTGTTTGPATTQGANPLMGALGGAATGASIASTLGLTGALGGAGGGIGAGLGGLMGLLALSDETTKKDIEKVGHDGKTDLDIYSFRYKGDPASAPKSVGPMAQDVRKKHPGAVVKLPGSGKLAIKRSFLSGMGLAA